MALGMATTEHPSEHSPPDLRRANRDGVLWMLVSIAGATAMTVSVRMLTPDVHTSMLAFLRAGFALVAILPLFASAGLRRRSLRFSAWKLHVLRGALIALALNCGFYSIWHLPMATATILFFTAPVFATLLAGPIVGERVGPRRWSAVGAGFVGALVVLRPDAGAIEPAMLAGLVSSIAFAVTLLIGRIAAEADGTEAVYLSSTVIAAIGTLPPALFAWGLPGEPWRWAVLAGLVAASSVRQYADIRAYSLGEAGFLAPFSYLRLLTVGLAGYLMFGETIDGGTLAGGAIIVASTLYIALRGSRQSRGARQGRAAP